MPKRLKFVVEQWVLFMVWRQMWQARRFDIFESARHFRIESGRPIRSLFDTAIKEGPGWAVAPPSPLLASPNVTAPPISGQWTNFVSFDIAL